jgi:uncharacterized membrane protein
MTYVLIEWVHVLSATVLFGTGIGSAYYLLAATLRRDAALVAGVARLVVWADWLFTATTAVIQPLTGLWLAHLAGFPLGTSWIAWSLVFYGVAIACWLPVVRLQMRMRDLAVAAARGHAGLPPEYWRCFRWWVCLGVPAFFAFVAIFYLMVTKPAW